jgi:hypothetical protein
MPQWVVEAGRGFHSGQLLLSKIAKVNSSRSPSVLRTVSCCVAAESLCLAALMLESTPLADMEGSMEARAVLKAPLLANVVRLSSGPAAYFRACCIPTYKFIEGQENQCTLKQARTI